MIRNHLMYRKRRHACVISNGYQVAIALLSVLHTLFIKNHFAMQSLLYQAPLT